MVAGHFPECIDDDWPETYAFAHFDGDLYDPALAFFEYVWPRMTDGGVLVVDDYYADPRKGSWPGVRKAVQEFFGEIESAESGCQAVIVK